MEGESFEKRVSEMIIPDIPRDFLGDLIEKESDSSIKHDEEELDKYLKMSEVYVRLFAKRRSDLKGEDDDIVASKKKKSNLVDSKKDKHKKDAFHVRKQLRMLQLKQRLKEVDSFSDYSEDEKQGRVDLFSDEEGRLYVNLEGNRHYVTIEDVVADYNWGLRYRPHTSIKKDEWRRLRKTIDINEAKSDIADLYDKELSHLQDAAPVTDLDNLIYRFKDKKTPWKTVAGQAAEKTVLSLLERCTQNDFIKFRIERANIIEDGIFKYDFKVFFHDKYLQGVATETDLLSRDEYVEQKKSFGVQFTISGRIGRKNKNTIIGTRELQENSRALGFVKRKVDNIVLVQVSGIDFYDAFKKWLGSGRPPGGPEQFLSVHEKAKVLQKVLKQRVDISLDQAREIVERKD